VSPLLSEIANLANGVDVPMPRVPLVGTTRDVDVAGPRPPSLVFSRKKNQKKVD
jgi:hypothetical protein